MKLFEQLINLLVLGAIVPTVVKTYLTANKIWSRKHEMDLINALVRPRGRQHHPGYFAAATTRVRSPR
jgi:hypothetical protein